ncbi:MAG: hypothetical protein J5I98_33370 [Phaeodactylibacter sp.]|nr:hypothetical protein [Phaeodactylibacter sp.]
MQDCRTLVLWPSLKKKGKGEIPNLFEVFYPGLTFSISSPVCIPEKGLAINLDGSEGQGIMQIGTFGRKDSNSPYADQIIDPTVGYIENVQEGVKVFMFEPSACLEVVLW